jgi:hypothetical protein
MANVSHDTTFFSWFHNLIRKTFWLSLGAGVFVTSFYPPLVLFLAEVAPGDADIESKYLGVKCLMWFASLLFVGNAFNKK